MEKKAKILPEEDKQKAIDNGLLLQTLYRRLQNGWDLEKAVTEKSKDNFKHLEKKKYKRVEGTVVSDRPKYLKGRRTL